MAGSILIFIVIMAANHFEPCLEKLQAIFFHFLWDINFCCGQLGLVTAQGVFEVADRLSGNAHEDHVLAIVVFKYQS